MTVTARDDSTALDWRLVLAAVSCGLSSDSPAPRARNLEALCASRPSWPAILALARWHRVGPLLHVAFKRWPDTPVPSGVAAALVREHTRTAARNLRTAAASLMILRRLEEAGLHPLTFKGPTLALCAYGALDLRVFEDVDVIVPREELARAVDTIEAAGFHPGEGLSREQAALSFAAGRGAPFVDPQGRVAIDLHASFAPRYLPLALDHAQLLPHTCRVPLLDGATTSLTREMLLVALAVHGIKHSWERLYWVSDVAALTRRPEGIDWDRVLSLAATWRVARIVRTGLLLARALLEAELPARVAAWSEADRVAVRLSAHMAARLERPAVASRSALEAARAHLAAIEGTSARVRFCFHVVRPNASDRRTRRLPAALFWLHYPMRVWRLITRGFAAERPPALVSSRSGPPHDPSSQHRAPRQDA